MNSNSSSHQAEPVELDEQVPATNCLSGIRCPECGSTQRFEIVAECLVTMVDNGTDEAGSFEWDDSSSIVCQECMHTGTVGQFKAPEEMHCNVCGEPAFVSIEGTSHHWSSSDDPLADHGSYIDYDADADHVAIIDLDEPDGSDSSDDSEASAPEPNSAQHEDPCILTGESHEDPDDCTTHPHESDVIEVMPSQLRGGETLVSESGQTLVLTGEVYRSSDPLGFYCADIDFGVLRLDEDLPVRVLSDD